MLEIRAEVDNSLGLADTTDRLDTNRFPLYSSNHPCSKTEIEFRYERIKESTLYNVGALRAAISPDTDVLTTAIKARVKGGRNNIWHV